MRRVQLPPMTMYLTDSEAAAMDAEIDAWAALGIEGQLAALIARDAERGTRDQLVHA
ncbi:MAG: hypothetical protein JWP01_3380 [Myxococcales bacterium]|nr:hypothetical protein [Myxococcales bacterium]